MDTKHEALITRLHDEADLCRNDGVPETAKLLDEAIARIEELERELSDASTSLETISRLAGRSHYVGEDGERVPTYMGQHYEVRDYAASRATVARALLTKKD